MIPFSDPTPPTQRRGGAEDTAMRTVINIIPAIIGFIATLFFMYVCFFITVLPWLVMMFTCPLAPFVFAARAFRRILKGDYINAWA